VVLEGKGKVVWFDTKESTKNPLFKSRTVRQKERKEKRMLTLNEELYLKKRIQKHKRWLPKRIRRCDRIKKVFKA